MEGIFVLSTSLTVAIILGIFFLWRTPKNCPKCHTFLKKEKINGGTFFVCSSCGHMEEIKKDKYGKTE